MLPRYVIPYIFFTQAYDCVREHGMHTRPRFIFMVSSKSFSNTHSISRMLARIIYARKKTTIALSSCNLCKYAQLVSPSLLLFFLFFPLIPFPPFVSCFIRFKRVQKREQDFKIIKLAESFLPERCFFFLEEYIRMKKCFSIHWLKQNLVRKYYQNKRWMNVVFSFILSLFLQYSISIIFIRIFSKYSVRFSFIVSNFLFILK